VPSRLLPEEGGIDVVLLTKKTQGHRDGATHGSPPLLVRRTARGGDVTGPSKNPPYSLRI